MKQPKRILAPTDLSEFSKIGVRYAFTLAQAASAEVTVYHVVDRENLIDYESLIEEIKDTPPDESMTEALLRVVKSRFNHYGEARAARSYFAPVGPVKTANLALKEFLRHSFSDLLVRLNVNEMVESGRAQERIVAAAKKQAADLIVMSTHGRSVLAHVLTGSVIEHVIRNAPCPVVAIGPENIQKMPEIVAAA